jgi:hypothetical protein
MPCPKTAERRAHQLLEKLKGVYSVADCITTQTAAVFGEITQYRAWHYLNKLAEAGYIDIYKIGKGLSVINLYCLPGRRPGKIYLHDGIRAYIIRINDVVNAVEKMVSGFATYTGAIRIRRLKDMLNLPNTAVIGVLLTHLTTSVLKDAVIRKEIRDSTGVYTIVLVVDRDKALKRIQEYKHGASSS